MVIRSHAWTLMSIWRSLWRCTSSHSVFLLSAVEKPGHLLCFRGRRAANRGHYLTLVHDIAVRYDGAAILLILPQELRCSKAMWFQRTSMEQQRTLAKEITTENNILPDFHQNPREIQGKQSV